MLDGLDLDPRRVIVVFRPPPEGALYHQMGNARFDMVLDEAVGSDGVQPVLLCRTAEQRRRYAGREGLRRLSTPSTRSPCSPSPTSPSEAAGR